MGNIQVIQQSDVIDAFKRNDEKVLRAVYQEVYPKVRRYVLANSGTESQAKDVYQEAFLACWQNVKDDKFDGKGALEPYLFTIAKNKWKDHLRSARFKRTVRKKTTEIHVAEEPPEFTIENEWQRDEEIMQQALDRLGAICKTLLRSFYFERKRLDEIASQIGIQANSARNKKYRCMEQLRSLAMELKNGTE